MEGLEGDRKGGRGVGGEGSQTEVGTGLFAGVATGSGLRRICYGRGDGDNVGISGSAIVNRVFRAKRGDLAQIKDNFFQLYHQK